MQCHTCCVQAALNASCNVTPSACRQQDVLAAVALAHDLRLGTAQPAHKCAPHQASTGRRVCAHGRFSSNVRDCRTTGAGCQYVSRPPGCAHRSLPSMSILLLNVLQFLWPTSHRVVAALLRSGILLLSCFLRTSRHRAFVPYLSFILPLFPVFFPCPSRALCHRCTCR
jgi:hypothetical protein